MDKNEFVRISSEVFARQVQLKEAFPGYIDTTSWGGVHMTIEGLAELADPDTWKIVTRDVSLYFPLEGEINLGGVRFYAIFDEHELEVLREHGVREGTKGAP